jgi:uncharacterized protein (DUF1810 family)
VTGAEELHRFVEVQDAGEHYATALRELRAGYKRSHWIWFVFPQIAGLGHSAMAQRYAIRDLGEAADYLAHPVLGRRLLECARVLADLTETDPVTIFGTLDALKLQSSMTLFAAAAPTESVFREVLDRYFGGATDDGTTSRISDWP